MIVCDRPALVTLAPPPVPRRRLPPPLERDRRGRRMTPSAKITIYSCRDRAGLDDLVRNSQDRDSAHLAVSPASWSVFTQRLQRHR
jgi:hypothetical protein